MTPDLRELRYFVAVAEELNFTQAARRLHVSQPSLSAAVRQLETRVGITLLDRTTRRVELTPAGATLLAHAHDVLEATNELDGALRAHRAPAGGRLRVGVFGHGAGERTPAILDAFRDDRPGAELDVTGVGPAELVAALADRRIDVLIAPGELHDDRLDVRTLFHEPRPFLGDTIPVVLATRAGERDPLAAAFAAAAERAVATADERAPLAAAA